MKSRILHTSYVIDFLDVAFDSKEISEIIKVETDEIISKLKVDKLRNWEIHIKAIYTNAKQILVYKKLGTYPNEKYKEIIVHIPIPLQEIVSWGVNKKQHIYNKVHLDNIIKNFDALDLNFTAFTNRTDYILDSMRRAIKFCFESGFSVNGVKIKINS